MSDEGSVAKGRVQQRRKRPPPLSLAGSASSLASDDGSCEGVPPMLLTPLGSSTASRTKSKSKPLWARRGVSGLTLLEAKGDDVVNDEDLTEVSLTDAEIDGIFSAGTEQLHQLSISESPSSSVVSDFTSPWWGAIADPGADAQHTARTARTGSSSSRLASPSTYRSVSSSMLKAGRPALTPTDSGLSVTSTSTPACAKVFADKSGYEEEEEEELHFGFVTAPVPGSFHDDPHNPKGFARLPTSVTASRRKRHREEREAARLRAMAARAEQEQAQAGEANTNAAPDDQAAVAAVQASCPAPACVPKTPAGDSAMVDSASHEVFGFPDEPMSPASPLSPMPPALAETRDEVQKASTPIAVPSCRDGARPEEQGEDDGMAFLRSANLVDDDHDDINVGGVAVAERRVSQAMDERAAWSFRCQLGIEASPTSSVSSTSSSSSWRRGSPSPLAPCGSAPPPSPPPLSTSTSSSTSASSTLRSWFGGLRRKTLRKEAAGTSAPSPNVFPGSYDQVVWRERAHSMHGGQQQTKRSPSPRVSPRRLRRTRSYGESKNKGDADAGSTASAGPSSLAHCSRAMGGSSPILIPGSGIALTHEEPAAIFARQQASFRSSPGLRPKCQTRDG